MTVRLPILALVLASAPLRAATLPPEANAAFDAYIQQTEADLKSRMQPDSFLWLDQHQNEKNLVWMNQDFIRQKPTPRIPGAILQDWIGELFVGKGATMERARAIMGNYNDYKEYFKPDVLEARAIESPKGGLQLFLRYTKRQLGNIVLNTVSSVDAGTLDPTHMWVNFRSTHIGEAIRSKTGSYEEELPPNKESGALWRINQYWRFTEAENGVYVELEIVALSRAPGLGPTKLLDKLANYPKSLVEDAMERMKLILRP